MARLVYWQHHTEEDQDFDSFEAALSFATYLADYEIGAPDKIIDGDRIVEGDELSKLVYQHSA